MPTSDRLSELHSLIMRETMRAEAAGAAPAFSTLQPLYAEKNTNGVDLSQRIARLCDVEHLCADIAASRFTLANINPLVWNDDLENALREATFPDRVTGGQIEIRSLMDSYYGSCWTDQPESQFAWDTFGVAPTKVRIESTVGRVLAALMHPNDPYFGLHLYAGLVEYRRDTELAKWVSTVKLDGLLDSEGRSLALALSVVRDDFQQESEVRIIYSHHEEDSWVQANVTLAPHLDNDKGFARIPCSWSGLIDSITVRSNMPATAKARLTSTLASAGLSVPIVDSAIV
ncbi:hypothetical protein [Duganella vulcania]|uniref:DUF2971 domain-containing protein n=1 Tax=Duganella vulcania TaxID=2692166 RepID=A0A845GGW1_9BURK|nr:hypothetical protein [Duganella vulcania]MYM92662.1 hypothetical protein [Duganella vulcania]